MTTTHGATTSYQERLGLTEVANSERFVKAHVGRVLFSKTEGWFMWDGSHWRSVSDAETLQMAKDVTDDMVASFPQLGDSDRVSFAAWCTKSRTLRGLQNMLTIASGHPSLRASVDEFDSRPFRLTTPSGVVDLKTLCFYEPHPKVRCSHTTSVPYDPYALCPEWEAYIDDRVGHDDAMAGYLQQALGQGLIGLTGERMYFLHGPTHCGKTTILEIVRMVLGSYATVVRPEVFMAKQSRGDSATPALAALRGIRFVKCSETKSTDQLDEAIVKLVTGTDRISVRRLYREPFDMKPAFTVYVATNRMPGLANKDDAISERPRVITLDAKHSGHDELYAEGIVAREGPGILRWLILGANAVVTNKTSNPPKRVQDSTRQYLSDNDPLTEWLAARCMRQADAQTAGLRKDYLDWCKEAGASPLGDRSWSLAMEAAGFTKEGHSKHGALYGGLKLRR